MKKSLLIFLLIIVLSTGVLTPGHPISPEIAQFGTEKNAALGPRRATSDFDIDVFPDYSHPRESLLITAGEINADAFKKQYSVNGEGITIAVIDTGVDASHPDLQKTTGGARKIIDWVDFTDEGLVKTEVSVGVSDGVLKTPQGEYVPPALLSRSGTYQFGVFSENQLDERGYIGQDINRNGIAGEIFGVLVIDTRIPGFYDTVIIDTKGDKNFLNEMPMGLYSIRGDVGKFTNPDDPNIKSSFVIAEIARNGRSVKLGFDGNGHGTHVAGIAAANGYIKGIAPGAKIMAIKALGSSGDGSWDNIAKAIRYAADNGADIINISIGSLASPNDGSSAQARLIDQISIERNILFVLAAGNDGPGINTNSAFGDSKEAITVGAYISPEIWMENYGQKVNKPGIWYYSSIGPGIDGTISPQVVAPGSAVSTVNIWDKEGYDLLDGTSMAAPHVSGAAALIMEKARIERLKITPRMLKRAFILGAIPIEGYQVAEQGYGLIDTVKTWELLKIIRTVPNIHVSTYNRVLKEGNATFFRDGSRPGIIPFRLLNMNIIPSLNIELISDQFARWDRRRIRLIRGTPRELDIYYDIPDEPGLYSGILYGNDPSTPVPELLLPYTVIVPYNFNSKSNITINDSIDGGAFKRYFIKVDQGIEELDIELSINVGRDGNPLGRVKAMLFDPLGRLHYDSQYVGLDYFSGISRTSTQVYMPQEGVWEVVVYSSVTIGNKGFDKSEFTLTVNTGSIQWAEGPVVINTNDPTGPINVNLRAVNGFETMVPQIVGVGLWKEGQNRWSRQYNIKHGSTVLSPRFDVPEGVYELRVSLEVEPGNDVDLYLYRVEGADYVLVGSSSLPYSPKEEVVIKYPEKGKYIAYMYGYDIPVGEIRADFSHEMFFDKGHIAIEWDNKRWNKGEEKELNLNIYPPSEGGSYKGTILVTDSLDGVVLAELPVVVNVNLSIMDLQIVLGRGGNFATLYVRDGEDGRFLDADIKVNGEMIFLDNGRATIPLKEDTLKIEAKKAGYIPLSKLIKLPNR